MAKIKLILGSSSPRRRQFLEDLNLDFTIEKSQINEEDIIKEKMHLPPERKAEILARAKALDVQRRFPNEIILGFDTIVVVDDEILGKPRNKQEAVAMLHRLSDTTHHVITGVCLLYKNRQELDHERTSVTFRQLADPEILEYVETGEPMDAAGAYKIQERAERFVKSISGDYNNVVGLPVDLFMKMLKKIRSSISD